MFVSSECGLTSINVPTFARRISGRIVGGFQAVPHSHPWQVLLSDRSKFCGGETESRSFDPCHAPSIACVAAVLNANWIVTAAHCVSG